jgi:NitT/TauT family transport system permease protein
MGAALAMQNSLAQRVDSDRQIANGKRGRRARWFGFKQSISRTETIVLGVLVWALFFGMWELSARLGWVNTLLVPTPQAAVLAGVRLLVGQAFLVDICHSVLRVVVSFILAAAVAVPLGILMGSFRRVEAFFNPLVSAWRYLPAPSFVPLLLMWFGTGEAQKLALLFIGVVWFLITAIMDHVKNVRTELIETSLTLGASRWKVLRTAIVPAAMPDIMIALRQMLAVSWTYLVIAEIVGATTGIGGMMMRAKRFIHVDEIMAGIVFIGLLGLIFDYLFRVAQRKLFPYRVST